MSATESNEELFALADSLIDTDYMFKIPYDCVMTISEPEPGLQKAYEDKLTQKRELENDGTNSTEN